MKTRLAALTLLSLAGCRTLDPALLRPGTSASPDRLPALRPQVRTLRLCSRADSAAVAADVSALFANELRQVLADTTGAPRGYAELTTRRVSLHEGRVYSFLSGLALGGLNLLGFPWARYRCVVEVQLDVRNRRHELLGTYYGQGEARATSSWLSRSNYARPERVLYLLAARRGLDQLTPQLQGELPQLRAALAAQ